MKNFVAIIFILLLTVGSCSKKESDQPTKTDDGVYAVFTFLTGNVLVNNVQTSVGTKVQKGDEISVGDRSIAVLQFGEISVITLKEKTLITVDKLEQKTGKPTDIVINQKAGKTFSKIMKDKSNYIINSKTMVAAVRGTEFEFAIDKNNKTSIKLSEGKLKLVPKKDDVEKPEEAVNLEKDSKIEVSESGNVQEIQTITIEEKKELVMQAQVKIVENVQDEKVIEQLKSDEPANNMKVIPDEIKKAIIPPKISLEDIKNQYGHLTVIKTKTGKEFIGYFSQSGKDMTINTVDGIFIIPAKDVAMIAEYNK